VSHLKKMDNRFIAYRHFRMSSQALPVGHPSTPPESTGQ